MVVQLPVKQPTLNMHHTRFLCHAYLLSFASSFIRHVCAWPKCHAAQNQGKVQLSAYHQSCGRGYGGEVKRPMELSQRVAPQVQNGCRAWRVQREHKGPAREGAQLQTSQAGQCGDHWEKERFGREEGGGHQEEKVSESQCGLPSLGRSSGRAMHLSCDCQHLTHGARLFCLSSRAAFRHFPAAGRLFKVGCLTSTFDKFLALIVHMSFLSSSSL